LSILHRRPGAPLGAFYIEDPEIDEPTGAIGDLGVAGAGRPLTVGNDGRGAPDASMVLRAGQASPKAAILLWLGSLRFVEGHPLHLPLRPRRVYLCNNQRVPASAPGGAITGTQLQEMIETALDAS
jgi:hypothetical protein